MDKNNQGKANEEAKMDYFIVSIEDGGFTLKPFCSCGEMLDEDFHCAKCERQCSCTELRCDSEETLAKAKEFIDSNPRFQNFTAVLSKP